MRSFVYNLCVYTHVHKYIIIIVVTYTAPFIARSPLYSHISSTLQGLLTIRTFKKEDIALRSFHSYQDSHTQVYVADTACAVRAPPIKHRTYIYILYYSLINDLLTG